MRAAVRAAEEKAVEAWGTEAREGVATAVAVRAEAVRAEATGVVVRVARKAGYWVEEREAALAVRAGAAG